MVEDPDAPEMSRSHLPFCPVTKVGALPRVSGQGSVGASGQIMSDTFEDEVRRPIGNLDRMSRAAGSELGHLVETRNYVRDHGDVAEFNRFHRDAFTAPSPARPAITNCLPSTLRSEIECIAVVRGDATAQGDGT